MTRLAGSRWTVGIASELNQKIQMGDTHLCDPLEAHLAPSTTILKYARPLAEAGTSFHLPKHIATTKSNLPKLVFLGSSVMQTHT